MVYSGGHFKIIGKDKNGFPILEEVPSSNEITVVDDIGGFPSAPQTNQNQNFISQHNEEKALRIADKEKKSFAKEDREKLDKASLHGMIQNVQIVPVPKRQVVQADPPVDCFIGGAFRWIMDMHKSYGVDVGTLTLLLLGFVSLLLGGKFKAMRHKNHVELVTLFIMIMMQSGRMKSPLMDEVLKPIVAIEKKLQSSFFEEKELVETKVRLIKKRIHKIENAAAKGGDLDAAAQEILELKKSIPAKLFMPVLLTFKFTPEGLEKEAARQNGRIGIAAAELGSFKKLSANRDDFLLQAYCGESFSSTKAGEPIRIENPAASILIATQDDTATKLLNNEAFQTDGLLARFLWLMSSEQTARGVSSEVPQRSVKWLEDTANKLFEASQSSDTATILYFEDQALNEWYGLEAHAKFESTLDNPPALQAFYRKLAGTGLRLSAILHLLRCCENGEPFDTPISQESVNGGVRLAVFLEQHAKVALNLVARNTLDHAHAVIDYLRESGDSEVKMRDIYRATRLNKSQTLEALRLLRAHGYLALYKSGTTWWSIVNPALWHIG